MSTGEIFSVYLAGPEVFFPEDIRLAIDQHKKAILEAHGCKGLSPSDNALDLDLAEDPAQTIYDANLALMERADGVIANLTPFRGPSADAGTIYELGFMIARGKPAMGFSVCATPYNDRVQPGAKTCSVGAEIEPFGLCDNLMLDCGLARAGGAVVSGGRAFPKGGFKPGEFFSAEVFLEAVLHFRRLAEGHV